MQATTEPCYDCRTTEQRLVDLERRLDELEHWRRQQDDKPLRGLAAEIWQKVLADGEVCANG
jgi:hypothetical protein